MKKKILIIVSCILAVIICLCGIFIPDKPEIKESVQIIQNTINNEIATYEMTEKEVDELPTTEIVEQTEEDEKNIEEQEVEDEAFELQGEIAYEGDKARSWNVTLGDYKGLTYYSQIDSRWSNKMYSSVGNTSQTIGSSGCGPTSAAMVVTSCKGAITPDTMSDLFVKYGYRSANNGTYWSAFRALADEFNIEYQETIYLNTVVELLKNNHIVVASCGNGLFTTGGHFIVLTGIEENYIKVYDPYLYSGKFDLPSRRGKAEVKGNTVYVSIDNFRAYANYSNFFCYKYEGTQQVNNSKPVVTFTSVYNRYVKVNTSLNIRAKPTTNSTIVASLKNNSQVTVYEISGNWSRIGTNQWVCSDYLVSTIQSIPKVNSYSTGTYVVNASVLNVRYGAGTNYKARTYNQLTANARQQNRKLGNYYTNGYKKGVVCTVTKVSGNWGLTASGWICLDYCSKR
ncbi:MAG: C39 family peptidase [Clostridia bacterium]|nr:C39 family peptidase [Clostridia bacterium]